MKDPSNFSRMTYILGSLSAGLGVALGAFGAHGLKNSISSEMLVTFETGVRYQMYHSLALLATAWASTTFSQTNIVGFRIAAWSFSAGILLFCGSLYLLSIAGAHWLGAVTPLGGVAFLIGWTALIWTLWRKR
jgi:uncharacterized membrane protein YgdD (TMEM256/DUF423 family)